MTLNARAKPRHSPLEVPAQRASPDLWMLAGLHIPASRSCQDSRVCTQQTQLHSVESAPCVSMTMPGVLFALASGNQAA